MAQPAVLPIAGRYEIRDRIGAGAMGQVIEAYDQRVRRLVPKGECPEARRRFRLEAQAAARLRMGCGGVSLVSAVVDVADSFRPFMRSRPLPE